MAAKSMRIFMRNYNFQNAFKVLNIHPKTLNNSCRYHYHSFKGISIGNSRVMNQRLAVITRSLTTQFNGDELRQSVKEILMKSPTKDSEKCEKQVELLQALCQHRNEEISSADVIKQAKNLTADELYELALAVYSLKEKLGEYSIEFWAPLFRMSALNGNDDAKYTYAQMLRTGTGVDVDLVEASKLFQDLSQKQHGYAQFALAGMYYHGIGVEQNFKEAFNLYEMCSKNGVDTAFSMLGNMYMNGEAVEQNNKLAIQYFQTGAKTGDATAQLSLAYCYSHGKGVSKDLEKAFHYHMCAANKGHPIGLYNVGTQYFSGKGTELDMVKSAEYFQKAADLGFDLAQVNLGNMYYNGLGVEKDWEKAKELYRKAAVTNKNAEALLKEVEEEEKKLRE